MAQQAQFESVARRFVSVVDSRDGQSPDAFLRELERALVDLYSTGLELESVQPDDDEAAPDGMSSDEASALSLSLGERFGRYDHYSFVFDPYDLDTGPVGGGLSDDVTGIYRDLLEGFAALAAGSRANAEWHWKFGFDHHWGRHAAHAIYALYQARIAG